MIENLRSIYTAFLFSALTSSLGGCTVGSSISLQPQSHFDYPNSNVISLGHTQGEVSTVSFFIPVTADADLEEEAIQKALQGKGGDILIDFVTTYKIVNFILPIYQTTVGVEGTAGKMTIGQRPLNQP